VVVGGARGIGFAMVKQMLDRTKGPVVATCRKNPATDHELMALKALHPQRLSVFNMDAIEEEQVSATANKIM